VQGIGMANVMAPATESIMSTLPREQAGAGSAVNNTMRQVGGALGVAVLGSLLSSTYRAKVTPTLDAMQLPKAARDAAGESIGALHQIIGKGGRPTGPQWQQGQNAFIHAMHWTSAGSALVVFVGMLVALKWLPGKTRTARQGHPTGVTEQVHA